MGGGKPLRMLGDRRLIDHALAYARTQSPHVAVSVRAGHSLPEIDVEQIPDEQPDWGPLAGLDAAFLWAARQGHDRLLTLPCDSPFLPDDLLTRLDGALTSDIGAAIASSEDCLHPVCALWRTGAHRALADYVATGRRSLQGFAERPGFVEIAWPAAPTDPFFNINSPEDLARAEDILSSGNPTRL
jgi:molybdopterin-guanine dinucleotide biosynthesis protein A